ncbi:MAG: alpha/beta fold hydrolase [bacterium]|nr:alpha/beta fold hydrolase [bacterium]
MKRLFLLATILFLSGCSLVQAEITNPYTVDEKVQVMFGDSTAVASYEGLQNYVTNYVNNYLHITFTYTHHRMAFASYPPLLYITEFDPRATTTPNVRNQQVIYQLAPVPAPPGHETDWYAYDVQFDATGYTADVQQAGATTTTNFHRDVTGQTTSDWVALANLYPRQDPLDAYSMSFTPLQIYDTPVVPVATTTPVIIVPGIIGSKLIDSGNSEIWPSTLNVITSITDNFLDTLVLNADGITGQTISSPSVIRNISSSHIFDYLFDTLGSSSFTENQDSFEFPYDWRLDILKTASDNESNAITSLKEKIDAIKAQRGVTKVDIVAHSMGGLLVKKYLKDYGGDSVDKFIDIGTPHTGAPKAFKALNFGDQFGFEKAGFVFLNLNKMKEISQNMPAVYQLLPSQEYFDDALNDYRYYVFNAASGEDRLTFDQTKSYLNSSGRNSTLVDRANTLHQEIDNLDPATYGVETYNIVGCGTPTIGQFYVLEDGEHPIYNIKMINGDGTVPLKSAEAMSATSTYYVRNAQHALMPSTSGVKELVAGILTSTSTTFDISPYSNLSTTSSGCTIPDGRIVSFHSPIELHIYDSSGNHVGPDANGDIENEITGVTYEVIGDNKFAFLPNGVNYTIRGNATNSGTFDVRIQELVSGEVATTTLWTDLVLQTTTQVQFSVNSNTPTQITLDNQNDGVYEVLQNVSTAIAGLLESTGKSATIVSNLETSNSGTSRPVATSSEPILEIATTTGEVLGVTIYSATSTIVSTNSSQARLPKSKKLEPSLKPLEPSQVDNTAIAYKSLGQKWKTPFVKLWSFTLNIIEGWVKSRL